MGLGAFIGAAVGFVGGIVRTAIRVQPRGDRVYARLHPDVAWVILNRALACLKVYRARTHARRDVVALEAPDPESLRARAEARDLVARLRKAQRDPMLSHSETSSARRRAELLAVIEQQLAGLVD